MKHHRCALLGAAVLAAGVLTASVGTADASLPSTADAVSVSSGEVHSGIDAAVRQYGAISGKIRSVATGGSIANAYVSVYSGSRVVATDGDDSTGYYQINMLLPGSYRVCVSPGAYVSGGGSVTGYLSRCYKTADWSGLGAPPSTALTVSVTAGSNTPNIDVSLPDGAAISGKVINAGGSGVRAVPVVAKNRDDGQIFHAATSGTGSYKLIGLTAASNGYTVCFRGFDVGAGGIAGYLGSCWKNIAWAGGAYPSTAAKVSVSLGHTHTGIDATLPRGGRGAIAGVVKDARTGVGLRDARVTVFNSSGRMLGNGFTDDTGRYQVGRLRAASRDFVCVYPYSASSPTLLRIYKGRCYRTVAWSGRALPSSGLTGVSVTRGSVHGNINFALPRTTVLLGSIAGTVRSGAAGNPVIRRAIVAVYTADGTRVNAASTDSSGFYEVRRLKPNPTGYIVCATAEPYGSASTTPPTRWAPHCYPNANWDGSNSATTPTLPSTATKVPLSAGQHKTGKNITLPVGGAISGHVTVYGSTNGATVTVEIFNPSTHGGVAWVNTSGPYKVIGLAGGFSYLVCFDRGNAPSAPYGTMPQCYNDKAWNGTG